MSHSLLSPSASNRWLNCPGSLLEAAKVPSTTSPYAEEGTTAHKWLERLCKGEDIKMLLLDDAEMYSYVTEAYEYIVTTLEGQIPASEQRVLAFKVKSTECYGTVDAWGVVGDELHVFDFKYGKGVRVDAKDNPQMMIYAAGLLNKQGLPKVSTVVCHIVQPRTNNFSMYSYTKNKLKIWVREYVKPLALLAITGKGHVVAGEHCRFCPLKGKCKATSFINEITGDYKALKGYEELSVEERIEAARKASDMTAWLKKVHEQLEADVIAGTVEDDRLVLVEKKGRTKITDEVRAAELLEEHGITNHSKSKLLPYGQLKKYADILAPVIEVPVTQVLKIVDSEEAEDAAE